MLIVKHAINESKMAEIDFLELAIRAFQGYTCLRIASKRITKLTKKEDSQCMLVQAYVLPL